MAPILENGPGLSKTLVKLGGSLLFPFSEADIDLGVLDCVVSILKHEVRKRPVIAVCGGGMPARRMRDQARQEGITDQTQLDQISIQQTKANAKTLVQALEDRGITACVFDEISTFKDNTVVVHGGTKPGQTTDTVLVDLAVRVGQSVVFKISKEPSEDTPILPEIALSDYLQNVDNYEPGQHVVIDKIAAEKAFENNITIVVLSPDIENAIACLEGREFRGTVFHPR